LTAAPIATVVSVPPVGTKIILQAEIPNLFVFDVTYAVRAGDKASDVAAAVTAMFNNGMGFDSDKTALAQAGVIAGNTPGTPEISVTNPLTGGVVTLSDQSGLAQPVFAIRPGNAAWDAGPQLGEGKLPIDLKTGKGIPPPPGSCLGQFEFAGWDAAGEAELQYFTLGVFSRDQEGDAELRVFTKNTATLLLRLNADGLFLGNGKQIA
jgi:hypothetical protein